jgi:hypothetical protein
LPGYVQLRMDCREPGKHHALCNISLVIYKHFCLSSAPNILYAKECLPFFAYWHYLILILDSCINLFCKSKSLRQLADPFLMNWLDFRAGEKSSFSSFYKDITWWNVQLHLSDSKHPSGFFRVTYNNMAVLLK